MTWTPADIPPQAGRTAVVTGANSGLGFHTALELARAGAEVVLAVRDECRGADAVERIRRQAPEARLEVRRLDVAELASVEAFAEGWGARPVDLLVLNAGVMAVPVRRVTPDGFELQFATNFLGHFALTARLVPAVRASAAPRIVTLASLAHWMGKIDFADLQGERPYQPWKAYSQSKLAMLMFALELQRRSERGGWGVLGVSAHPGYATTNRHTGGPNLGKPMPGPAAGAIKLIEPWVSHPAANGALPVLQAATDPAVAGGSYWGPGGFLELSGPSKPARIARHARDQGVAERLWREAEALTGVRFPG